MMTEMEEPTSHPQAADQDSARVEVPGGSTRDQDRPDRRRDTDPETVGERVKVTLSLVSHTNVGKTTLARTLLRKDVGEVLDQAHVTEEAEMFELVATDEAGLRLWDTPGFGDSARLLKRLRVHDKPLYWFFQQAWDRLTDRPLWSSQQAALNIREEADLVLYLVNATEEPDEAGYPRSGAGTPRLAGRAGSVAAQPNRRSGIAPRVAGGTSAALA